MENDSENGGRRRSFVKRLNLLNEQRPKSLISYDSATPQPMSPSALSAKSIPPVLMRARANLSTTGETGSTPISIPGSNATNRRASLGPLEDLVLCGLCLERLTSPKMLNCQHTFCLVCLESEFEEKHKLVCPTCKIDQNILNDKEIINLPSNLYIDSLLKLLKSNPSTSPGTIQVDNDVEIRCIKCQTICSDNGEKCRHCKQNFCQMCWDEHLNELSKQTDKLDEQLNVSKEKINHKLDEFKDRIESLKKHINDHVDGQIALLYEKRRLLTDEADTLLHNEQELSSPLIERIRQLKSTISSSRGDSNDRVTSFMNFHRQTSEIFAEISKIGERRTIFNTDNFAIDIQLDEKFDGAGETDDVENENATNPSSAAVVKKKFAFDDVDAVKAYYTNKTFKLKFIWTKCPRPAGIGMAPWVHMESGFKLLYVTGSDSRIVYGIETIKGRIIHKISYEEMIFPNAICFCSERREIFVSDKWKHCIFVFSEDGEYMRTLGAKGDLEGFLRSPEGIAIGKNNTILVCDTGNDRIQGLDVITGTMKQQIGLIKRDQMLRSMNSRSTSIVSDLKAPTGVGTFDDHIIVLDSGNRRVKIFNKKGDMMKEFGMYGTALGQFKYPEVIAIDPCGFIFVGDGGNTKVQIFQPNGQLLTSFGTRGALAGKFNWISGVSITKELQLVVSDYKNHTVQIFE